MTAPGDFFIAGGSVRSGAPCYLERIADRQILEALERGEFCYVLTSRQMGKSSSMVRTAARLRETGSRVAVLDLTAIGQNVTAEAGGLANRIGVYVGLDTEPFAEYAGHRAGERFLAASVMKIAVMLALERLWGEQPGRRTPDQVRRMERMMRESNNEDANTLIRGLGGFVEINAEIGRSLGSPRPVTRIVEFFGGDPWRPRKNSTTPREVGLLLARISRAARAGDPRAAEMLRTLRGTSPAYRARIPRGLPPEYRPLVANKTGTLPAVVNDAAIIETPTGRRYVLCILLDGVRSRAPAEGFCRQVSQSCWREMVKTVPKRDSDL